jgi:hypothetical protein
VITALVASPKRYGVADAGTRSTPDQGSLPFVNFRTWLGSVEKVFEEVITSVTELPKVDVPSAADFRGSLASKLRYRGVASAA